MNDRPAEFSSLQLSTEERSRSTKLYAIGLACAVLVSGAVFGGYAWLRKRHVQDVRANIQSQESPAPIPKGPNRAQILVDEAVLKGENTIIGGTVKNISNEELSALSVEIELKRRVDGKSENKVVPIEPPALKPQQEGRYQVQLRSADFSSARVISLRSGDSSSVAFAQLPGQKRPPEKIEGRTIVVGRSGPSNGFLNTPDKPVRVP